MRAFLALLLLLTAPGWSAAAGPDPALPQGDQRAIRELQDKAYGVPTLAADAPKQEGLLALAELGSTAVKPGDSKLDENDYSALLALLQRYRDDLLKMGMDSSELQAQLTILTARVQELEERLKALKPKDGLKLFGRFYSAFDDLHVLGPGFIPSTPFLSGFAAGSFGKPADTAVRTQIGEVHTELSLEGTRGPVTGYAQMDLVVPWGETIGNVGLRKVRVELRTPISLQFGDLDAFLTPLTLWRNDDDQPFEPSLFAERRQRMEDDLLLKPHAWSITGVRASTDALLFNTVTLRLESLSGMAGNASGSGLANLSELIVYETSATAAAPNQYLAERYNTYLQGWKVSVPMLDQRVTLGYEGLVFFDVASTAPSASPTAPSYVPLNEFVHSLSLGIAAGGFALNAEAATGSYQAPLLNTDPQSVAGPLTGTALTADAAWMGDSGHIKVYGRYVTSGFHASGAQGRTVDYSYQYLGPFLTENSEVGANGSLGLNGTGGTTSVVGNIPLSGASRLNDQLIPPGVYVYGKTAPGGIWQNLLAYGPGEEIDPYGAATPNRSGGGIDAKWSLFHGGLVPQAGADFSQEIDPVVNTVGVAIDPFTMSRFRGGLTLDLDPWFQFPLRLGGGYTATDSQNGQQDSNAVAYAMSTQLMDLSAQWNAGKPVGIQAGYRHLAAKGQDETFVFEPGGESWDVVGLGVWWRPQQDLSFDVISTLGHTVNPSNPNYAAGQSSGNLEVDQTVARVTLEF